MRRSLRPLALFARRGLGPFLSPRRVPEALRALPWFLQSRAAYARESTERIPLLDTFPMLFERSTPAGAAQGHYFHQDLWAARRVHDSGVHEHVDVGSRVDGFVAHCASFTRVVYIDVRPLGVDVDNVHSRVGTVVSLPFADQSVESLSCLHVAEHVGLGRYGDPIDPDGAFKAMRELARVLAPRGNLYFGIPIGRERVCFNAHRVFFPRTVRAAFAELELVDFQAVDDAGALHKTTTLDDWDLAEYACGLFHFRRG